MKGEQLCFIIVCHIGNMLLCVTHNAGMLAMAGQWMSIIPVAGINAAGGIIVIRIILIHGNVVSHIFRTCLTNIIIKNTCLAYKKQ